MGDEERTAARARGTVGGEGGRAEELQPATLAVHAGRPGWRGDGETGLPRTAGIPTSPPIHLSTAYWHPTAEDLDRAMAGEPGRYSYARFGSPTVAALEEALGRPVDLLRKPFESSALLARVAKGLLERAKPVKRA
ncbi:MAG: PLP-dependent transferase [Bryobacteraceae bacterium]|nr:PLP-dependent transferase [Bryobacteraceae bacterium]